MYFRMPGSNVLDRVNISNRNYHRPLTTTVYNCTGIFVRARRQHAVLVTLTTRINSKRFEKQRVGTTNFMLGTKMRCSMWCPTVVLHIKPKVFFEYVKQDLKDCLSLFYLSTHISPDKLSLFNANSIY